MQTSAFSQCTFIERDENTNAILTNLDGLQNLLSIGGDISITANATLSEFCGLQPLLNASPNGVGTVTISGNAANPSVMDIQNGSACSRVLPLPGGGVVVVEELPLLSKTYLFLLFLVISTGLYFQLKRLKLS